VILKSILGENRRILERRYFEQVKPAFDNWQKRVLDVLVINDFAYYLGYFDEQKKSETSLFFPTHKQTKKYQLLVKNLFNSILPAKPDLSDIKDVIYSMYMESYLTGIGSALDQFNIRNKVIKKDGETLVFELTSAEILSSIADHIDKSAEYATDTSLVNMQTYIADSIFVEGETVFDTIESLYATGIPISEAYRIVQTEVQTGIGTARHDMFTRSGVRRKKWLTVGDMRVRRDHILNEKQGWISIHATYQNGAMHPGSYPSSINCRCVNHPDLEDPNLVLDVWTGF